MFFITLVDCIPLLSLLLDQILFKGLMMLKGLFSENKNVQILTYQFPSFYYIPNEFSTGSIAPSPLPLPQNEHIKSLHRLRLRYKHYLFLS